MGEPLSAKLVAEFVGTFLLVFTVGCNVLGHTPVWGGVSIASVLMVAIYALGGISGANFNPAVSCAIALSTAMKGPGDMGWKTCAQYCGVQILAGVVAAFSYAMLFWDAFYLGPSKGFGMWSAGLCEILYTLMLCYVVLNVAVADKNTKSPNQFYGLAIGFVIIAGAYGAGIVSGGCFNPAVAVGIDISSAGLHHSFGWCIFYAICEIIGAALAVVFFKVVRPSDFGGITDQSSTLRAELTSEFLGTFFLVLTVGLNVLGNSPAGAFSIAASLMCMIYATGDVSGAHFNPAVTVAILCSSMKPANLTTRKALFYIIIQIAAGITASLTYSLIYSGKSFPLEPLPGHKWSHVAVAEVAFTFVLCYVVLCTAVANTTKATSMFGLAIGSCVTVGGFAIGSISGGSLNPAVSIGIGCSSMSQLSNALVYSVFELIGAGLAVGVAEATHGAVEKAARAKA